MTRYLALFTLFIATLGAGCSAPPAGESGATAPAAGSSSAPSAPATQVHDGRAVEITGNDTMKFSVTEIVAKQFALVGQQLRDRQRVLLDVRLIEQAHLFVELRHTAFHNLVDDLL